MPISPFLRTEIVYFVSKLKRASAFCATFYVGYLIVTAVAAERPKSCVCQIRSPFPFPPFSPSPPFRSPPAHCQWHQLAYSWRHAASLNWSNSTQAAMNWDVFNYRTTWDHGTLWSHQLEHLSSATTTGKSVKSTLAVRCYVSSAVHIYHHSTSIHTLPLTIAVTYS